MKYRDLLLFAAYATVVLITLNVRPLWVDELNQMLGRSGGWYGVIEWAKIGPGGTPLAYLLQHGTLNLLGFSTFTVRLVAALFGIASVAVFYLIAQRSLAATALFAFLPLIFRYEQEARPYSQGLFFTLLGIYAFSTNPILLGLACVLGLYSQTLVLFPVLALLAVSLYDRRWHNAIAILIALALWTPWFLAARHASTEAHTMAQYFFSWKQLNPLSVLHDMTGGGYWTTIPLLALAAYGWTRPKNNRVLTTALFTAAFLGPIAADIASNYFFADRQLLFCLPILLLWAGYALETEKIQWTLLGFALGCASITKDSRYPRTATENWATAAQTIQAQLQPGACLMVAPSKSLEYFAMFQPQLQARECPAAPTSNTVLVVQTPYSTPEQIRQNTVRLQVNNYVPDTTAAAGGMLFRRYAKSFSSTSR